MKFYKRKTLDQHNPSNQGFAVEYNGDIVTDSVTSMQLPAGSEGDKPTKTDDGQIRYNTTLNDIEAHDRGIWERVRTVRPAKITVQNLGYGNYVSNLFGPMNEDYAASYDAGPENIMVYVDNVYQIPTLNYELINAPADTQQVITGDVYAGETIIPISTFSNILVGQRVSGVSAIPADTFITGFVATSTSITISNPTTDNIGSSTPINFSYNTGTYLSFSGPVPYKPVVSLLGFDGYFPPN